MNTDFFELVGLGAVPEIAEAVSARPELASSRNSEGVSALLWAVYCGQEPARRFLRTGLAAAGVDLDIFEAAATGDGERVRAILETAPDAACTFSGDGWTPLHLAAAFGTPEAVAILLAGGASVDAVSRNAQKNQPLHAALALGRNPETIQLLLEHGAHADSAQAGGFTAIFSAAAANRRDLAELLIAHGADAHHRSNSGKTPAEFARERGHGELSSWLEGQPEL
jgi:ankyrin repeat protein